MTVYDFALLNVPFANGAPSNEIEAFPDFLRGLGIAFDQTDGKPEMKGLNGLFQQITTSIIYLKQRGIAEWDNSLEYPVSSFVVNGGALYKAKTKNTGKNPTTSQNDWQIWASVSDITVSTNGNLKKTSNPDGSIHLEVPTASTTYRGVMRFATSTEVVNASPVAAAINPINALSIAQSVSFGVNQKRKDVTAQRVSGATYWNNGSKSIEVSVYLEASGNNANVSIYQGGVFLCNLSNTTAWGTSRGFSFTVPPYDNYRIDGNFTRITELS